MHFMNLNGEQLQLKYIPLDQVILWDENPKKHDIGALMQSREHKCEITSAPKLALSCDGEASVTD